MKDKKYKFYKYENNPEGSDYCFCQRPCDSNMSLHCFLDNGEILGFMSESLVYKHPEIKEIDMNEFMHDFIKPLIKENQQLKEKLEASEKASDDVLDLIKKGDYVNGKKVIDKWEEPDWYGYFIKLDGETEIPTIRVIQSIVTKEQFENKKYEVIKND